MPVKQICGKLKTIVNVLVGSCLLINNFLLSLFIMGTAKFKFNNGNMAILCSNCDKIVKTGKDFTEQEWAAMEGKGEVESIYCTDCEDKVIDIDKIIKDKKNDLGLLKDIIPILAENEEFKENLIQIMSEKILNTINLNEKNGK